MFIHGTKKLKKACYDKQDKLHHIGTLIVNGIKINVILRETRSREEMVNVDIILESETTEVFHFKEGLGVGTRLGETHAIYGGQIALNGILKLSA